MKVFINILLVLSGLAIPAEANHIKHKTNNIYQMSAEAKLRGELIERYSNLNPGRDLRPLYPHSTCVNVSVGVSLKNLVRVDEKTRTATLNVWEVYEWTDEFLKWDPDHFEHMTRIELRSSDIWTPDVKVYQSFDPDSNMINGEMLDVQYNGLVTLYPVFTRNIICDEEEEEAFKGALLVCTLQYGSWVYDGTQLDVSFRHAVKEMSLLDYRENPDYKLVAQSAEKEVERVPGCASCVYPRLTFKLHLKKKSNWW